MAETLHIAICEDEIAQRDKLLRLLDESAINNVQVSIKVSVNRVRKEAPAIKLIKMKSHLFHSSGVKGDFSLYPGYSK